MKRSTINPTESDDIRSIRISPQSLIVVLLALTFLLNYLDNLSRYALLKKLVVEPLPDQKIASDVTAPAKSVEKTHPLLYQPSSAEEYIYTHLRELKLDASNPEKVPTCSMWTSPSSTPYYRDLRIFLSELEDYYKRLEAFRLEDGVTDLRHYLKSKSGSSTNNICQTLELHSDGLPGIFAKSQQLSHISGAGWIEPLLPPMRNPKICWNQTGYLMDVQYMVHDFATICRSLTSSSRTVFVDIGASLDFHGDTMPSPVFSIWDMFQKFGIRFDHIYALEVALTDPKQVFRKVPSHLKSAYHWINVGAETDPESELNPWKLLLGHFQEDDLVIVKVDLDAPDLEKELVHQLLENPKLTKLVDHFYFEHHVNQLELYPHWGASGTKESVKDSLELFRALREKGVAAHFWV